jgi:general secretion pathway protein K
MTPALLAVIRPHLTLYGPPEPNAANADPLVAAALAQISPLPQAPAPANQPLPDLVTARIKASAFGPGNARVTKTAIVRVGPALPGGYTVLAWSRAGFD